MLQRDLVEVLVRFREKPVAIVCDISEMYLQVSLAPEVRTYHRFLWCDLDSGRPPDVYEFQRVVFGVNASPFLAQYVTQQHAHANEATLPLAADAVLLSTYMDDTMTSVDNSHTARQLYNELTTLWQKAGMHARKWLSNSTDVLAAIPPTDRVGQLALNDAELLPSVKTLGLLRNSETDKFTYSYEYQPANRPERITKRRFLKRIATIFDPLALTTPFTIRAKILLQEMWLAGCDWDDPVPDSLEEKAIRWFADLPELAQVYVPRCIRDSSNIPTSTSLHVFADASEQAYSEASYIRHVYSDNSISCRLVSSKVPVQPAAIDTTEMKRQTNVHSHLTFQHQHTVLNRLDPRPSMDEMVR